MVSDEVTETNKKPPPIFKNPTFQQKFRPISSSGKKRTWRSLKQVLAQERSLPWPSEVVHYSSINAPPSFKPAKKYSDISGLPASISYCFSSSNCNFVRSELHQLYDEILFLIYRQDTQIPRVNYIMRPLKNLLLFEVCRWISPLDI
ncbi:INO80 complex subunit C isoform X2 [Cephus cinctus]|uniref:INO80 complex subunit C isoform X2 n=1 Tax=Cephus cinctus TaxID=211228 RepID=A0AAJ7RMG3_CEPCN|nr:INO80 complex subunit C isoform X2 [Cephus cinctus]XP_024943693.1 INO80 complex subunit C isoform X2 [Cephus cinctus]